MLLARRIEAQETHLIPQIQIQPRIRRKIRKRLMLAHTRRLERNAIVSAVRQASHTFAPIPALAGASRVVAAGQDHFVPEKG